MEMYFYCRNIEIYNVLHIVILRGVISLTVFTYCSIEITIFFSLQTLWFQFLSNLVLSTLKMSEYPPHVGGRGQYILQVPVNEYVHKFKEFETMQVLRLPDHEEVGNLLTCFANKLGRSSSNRNGSLLYVIDFELRSASNPLLWANHLEPTKLLSHKRFSVFDNSGDTMLSPDVGLFPSLVGNPVRGGGASSCRRDLLSICRSVFWCCSLELGESLLKRWVSSFTTGLIFPVSSSY